ncbi:hypothetical protein DY000_02030669 [Brassica cretica]|uniref:Uncharacterized protein n=1 Tax=Brassica cretica TaxID=69181 RepID=A0ABQ7DQV2_BRACR|nr:hypothetical protein DY000_02030669 [Brassica cretica]
MAQITHLPYRHAATRSKVASPITCVFASCPELIFVRPHTRHGPRVDTNDSHDTPPECRTLTEQVRGFMGFPEVSLPSKPTNRRQLDVLATILANKTKLCGQPPKHPIEMRKELLGGGPVKEKHMSSCLKEVSKQLHLPETSKHA